MEEEKSFCLKNSQVLKEALADYVIQECKKQICLEEYEFSDDFKKEMNKIFKDLGIEKIPHPEIKI